MTASLPQTKEFHVTHLPHILQLVPSSWPTEAQNAPALAIVRVADKGSYDTRYTDALRRVDRSFWVGVLDGAPLTIVGLTKVGAEADMVGLLHAFEAIMPEHGASLFSEATVWYAPMQYRPQWTQRQLEVMAVRN